MKNKRAGDRSMMLRLLLVGMVAALGVTIPGGTNRASWIASAERWGNSVLVNWDTWRPDNSASRARRVGSTRHECEQCRLARTAIALRERTAAAARLAESKANSTVIPTATGSLNPTAERHLDGPAESFGAPTVAFERIEAGDDFYIRVAFELNRVAEGVDLAQAPTIPTAALARPLSVALAEGALPDLPEVLCGVTDEDAVEAAPMAITTAQPGETGKIASGAFDSIEAGDDYMFNEMEAMQATTPAASPVLIASTQSIVSVYRPDLLEEFACQTGPMDELDAPTDDEASGIAAVEFAPKAWAVTASATPGIPIVAPIIAERMRQSNGEMAGIPWPVFAPAMPIVQPSTRVAVESSVPWPVFAPIEPIADAKPTAESLSSAMATRHGTSSDAGWGQAVDLTRQAMSAWMSVLIRTAPVEMTAR